MKKFIAYFDLLGYKEFLLRNSEEHLRRRASHILRDIELSLSQDKTKKAGMGAVADLSNVTINCLNISDTVIFSSQDDSIESCLELLNVSYAFNWKQILFNFPVRGCIIYDNFEMVTGQQYNAKGASYSPNLMYGKGLYSAHEKVELLNWAGTVIDSSLVEQMIDKKEFYDFLKEKAIKYKVPYKGFYRTEYALRLVHGELNDVALANEIRNITGVFESDSKSVTPSVEEKMKNTIEFLKVFKEKSK